VEFRILGALEVRAGSQRLDLGGSRQQTVLAMLLLSAGHVVTTDRLLEAVYGEDLPSTARSQMQICISALRQLLAAGGGAELISTHVQGYALQAGDGEFDHQRFAGLTAAARIARDAGQLDQALAGYRDALRLWRGPALAGLDSQLIRAAAGRLDEERVAALEDRVAVELDLGRHRELAGELTELVAEFPLRERLRGQLMLALYRCDRSAEALQAYRHARHAMIEELGIEPGERLQRLERDILRSDPALEAPVGPVSIRPEQRQAPKLLPTGIADFTGRAEQIERVRQHLLSATGHSAQLAVPVVVITGQGGVGKTCLAVRSAHSLAADFPDGQLFADLHGGSGHPVGPLQVLERFLRALGVPGAQVPEGLDERSEVYRNLLADRRFLVVLDDVASEGQVSPLLPGAGSSAVLITSRGGLAGLAGAEHLPVNIFDEMTSLELLGRIAGADRVRAQPEATSAVAGRCGHLPLALRIAGARLAARPHRSIQQLADRLNDEQRRLDELRHGELGVRVSISVSYQGAGQQARLLFRRLALLDMPGFSDWLSVALLDGAVADAEDALDDLVRAQLIEATGPPGHYRFHDLIRVFAAERLAAEEPTAERDAALRRALGALLFLAEEALKSMDSGPWVKLGNAAPRWRLPAQLVEEQLTDPLAWGERERATLAAGIRQAARSGLAELCWQLASFAVDIFESSASFDDWREAAETGLAAARAAGHVCGEATMLASRGGAHLEQRRLGQARRDLEAACRLFREAGEDMNLAMATRDLATVDRLNGRLNDAARGYEQALAAFREAGDSVRVISALINLARVSVERGEHQNAAERLADARRMGQSLPRGRVRAQLLCMTGDATVALGEPGQAITWFDQALAIVCDIGDPVGQAHVLRGLGVARLRLGDLGAARATLERARELAGSVGDQLPEAQALLGLSEVALASGDQRSAASFARQAAGAFRAMSMPILEEQALNAISSAHAALGDNDT
jgi:DNA-binding SARP family transcriptional activator